MKSFLCSVFSFLCSSHIQAQVDVKLVPFLTEGIESPVYITPDPAQTGRYYVIEQKGVIRTITNGALDREAFLDIEAKVESGGEMGLLGLAFHPKYATNGRYFVNYTTRIPKLTTIVSEFRAGGAATERLLLKFEQPYSNHNGGHLAFDRTGHLFITAGDGGSGGDPHNNGQRLDTFLGKILRIDVDNGVPYAVPKDNPFVNNARPEIYAYGLRNVWRFSFDRVTGALWAGDVGQDKWEEIDIIEKGGNYGWRTMEGAHCFNPPQGCNQAGLILPVFEYPRSQGVSITGGYVYRGTKIPALQGVYVYGDYGSGKIWGLTYDAVTKKVVGNQLLLNSRLPISSFGEDTDGELFVVALDGRIFRLEPKPAI